MLQGAISSLCVYLGHELGLYKNLKSLGPSSPQQLASAAGLSERWVTEWLYQQSASRLVCCDSEAKRCVCMDGPRGQWECWRLDLGLDVFPRGLHASAHSCVISFLHPSLFSLSACMHASYDGTVQLYGCQRHSANGMPVISCAVHSSCCWWPCTRRQAHAHTCIHFSRSQGTYCATQRHRRLRHLRLSNVQTRCATLAAVQVLDDRRTGRGVGGA